MRATIGAGPPHSRAASAGAGPALSTTLQVRNVVASARVAESLRLDDLAATIPGAVFDPTFPKLVIRPFPTTATALVFRSGKVVLTLLGGAGAELHDPAPAPKIANLVASGTLGQKVALHRLALSRNLDRIEFDPE
ncbi:MAG: hypothetical protein ABFC38_01485 [Methanospirillum sp.]